ncbi:anthranilate synthase component I [Pseudohongiella spirulinae]|uniref:Anthranilate synthase n=1 Tax=Pseudohongiella spirulinae TaxID=1249552 RepID=A0A0S2KBL3_9GAMM|nr:anthranilate synthase component I [Pseudohongiella spirulinae]ALO45507.1 anthranilate synthase [Pseudohongiella spirulinae]
MSIKHSRYISAGGVPVSRQVQPCDGVVALAELTTQLDSQPGILLSCGVDYPGRYRRKDLIFVNPPVRLTGRDRRLDVCALNQRGRIMLPEFALAIAGCADLRSEFNEDQSRLVLTDLAQVDQDHQNEETRTRQPGLMRILRIIVKHFASPDDALLGLYGAFAYDLAFQFEACQLRRPRADNQRDLVLYLPDEILTIDPLSGAGERHRYEFVCRDQQGHQQVTGGLRRQVEQLSTYQAAALCEGVINADLPVSDHSAEQYISVIKQAREKFARGELFEVVPGRVFSQACREQPSAIYKRLRRNNPAPYGALMNLGSGEFLIAASPEMFVRVAGDRVESCPISGTIKRGANALQDAEQIRTLLNSPKEEAELSMCTDVDRNDKNRVCVPGTVKVIGRRQVELYSKLIHTVDHVEGRLLPEFDALDAFLSHTWAVTVTGAPKRAAMQFIEEHEKSPRRWYGGAFGSIGFDGSLDTGLTLRTIHLLDGQAHVRAGATLLHDSDPQQEEAETRLKASALLEALQPPAARPVHGEVAKCIARPSLRVLMVDHQDSFVHSLAAGLRQHGAELATYRPAQARRLLAERVFDLVVLSPGPGLPRDFDCQATLALCEQAGVPVFGVCLGLQAMVEYCGGRLMQMNEPVHGKASRIVHSDDELYAGLKSFVAGRYHSLIGTELPADLLPTAYTDDADQRLMSIRHRHLSWMAVQFHPESILSQNHTLNGLSQGERILQNVMQWAAACAPAGLKAAATGQ